MGAVCLRRRVSSLRLISSGAGGGANVAQSLPKLALSRARQKTKKGGRDLVSSRSKCLT